MRYKVLHGFCLGGGIDANPGDAIYSPGNKVRELPDTREPQISEAWARIQVRLNLIQPWPEEPAAAAPAPVIPQEIPEEIPEEPLTIPDAQFPRRGRGRKQKEIES